MMLANSLFAALVTLALSSMGVVPSDSTSFLVYGVILLIFNTHDIRRDLESLKHDISVFKDKQ